MSLPLPERKLRRVLFISALDGWSIALFAGLCTVISLCSLDWIGAGIGAIITAAGVIELRGRGRLQRGDEGGMTALVRAQQLILGTIWAYSLINLATYNEARILAEIPGDLRSALSQAGMNVNDFQPYLRSAFFGFYFTVMVVTLFFQGGLALYYSRRRAVVSMALAARTEPPAVPTSAQG